MAKNGLFSLFDFIFEAGPFTGTNRRKALSSLTAIYEAKDVDTLPEPACGASVLKKIYMDAIKASEFEDQIKHSALRLSFVIKHDGSQSNLDITGLTPSNDKEELLKRIKKHKVKWSPGSVNNKTVRVRIDLDLTV